MTTIYPHSLISKVKLITEQYQTQLEQMADEIRTNLIIPLCDNLNYRFVPHMGADETWVFYNEIGIVVDHSMLPSDVILALNVKLIYFKGNKNRLGQYVPMYQPAGFVPTY